MKRFVGEGNLKKTATQIRSLFLAERERERAKMREQERKNNKAREVSTRFL
jgi:hypothetical protein